MNRIQRYTDALDALFARAKDKRRAHEHARPILSDMTGDDAFLTEVLAAHLRRPKIFETPHYPVVSIPIARTASIDLIANCWIPLPDGNTDLSTKAIHHHGAMLLTTATGFGPGYEHWQFSADPFSPGHDIYPMTLRERAPHPRHHLSFVDAYVAHVPFYPPSLTITFALWSNSAPTTWRDHLKAQPLLKKHSARLRGFGERLGLAKAMDLKVVEYFDYCPTENGFRIIKERTEFLRGPSSDFLPSLFHVLQKTNNALLAREVRRVSNDAAVLALAEDLEKDRPIAGRLSAGHTGVPFANFTARDIERALQGQ